MSKKLTNEILVEQLKDSSTKVINLLSVIEARAKNISDIARRNDVTKVAKAYIEEEEQKLLFIQDLIKTALWEAYPNDNSIAKDTMSYSTILKNFDIELIAKRK